MKLFRCLLITVSAAVVMTSCGKFGGKAKLTTEADSVSYYLGIYSGMQLKRTEAPMPNINYDAFAKAVKEVLESKDEKINVQEALMYLNKYFGKVMAKMNEKNLKEGEEFLARNKTKKGIITTSSGLQYEIVKEGTGQRPTLENNVTVQYVGKLIDGTVFESSIDAGKPVNMEVKKLIKGWQEALQMMKVGSKYIIYVPTNLAYGLYPQPGGKVKPNMALIFELELLSIEPPQPQNAMKKK
jgi:FKBP-type peptidyl-prolyl cis-trans isomerase FkpA